MSFDLSGTAIPDFQNKYIDLTKDKADIFQFLAEQKESFTEFLETLTPEQLDYKYAENKWTLRQLLVHIFDTEQIFNYRALCIARGDEQALPGFDQDQYIDGATIDHLDLEYLINYFTITRYNSLVLFKGIPEELWSKSGHVSNYTMTLKLFPYMISGHLEYHWAMIKQLYIS